jgi:hypothetical protein
MLNWKMNKIEIDSSFGIYLMSETFEKKKPVKFGSEIEQNEPSKISQRVRIGCGKD